MSAWFDTYARRSARASTPVPRGVSRRRVLTGGSAAVASAWAVPLLTSAPAYAYGVSSCPSARRLRSAERACSSAARARSARRATSTPAPRTRRNGCAQNGRSAAPARTRARARPAATPAPPRTSSATETPASAPAAARRPASTSRTPAVGYGSQCAGNAQCAPGFGCGDCALLRRDLQRDQPCGDGLTCISNVCRQTCGQKNDCPSRAAECVSLGGAQKYCN